MKDSVIGVIGLGYVGLPLAVAFGRHFRTIGYDIKTDIVESYRRCVDPTGELSGDELRSAERLEYTDGPERLREADVIVVAAPTPIDIARQPDLGPITSATRTAGRHMKKGAVVVFESTVYPGLTEEVCVPILEAESGLSWKTGFHVGYSPERINPGDKEHTLATIVKVVAGDDEPTLDLLAGLYGTIVTAGVHRAESIRVAEAAKVIENTQRDLNIALMNELAVIFDNLGIDTQNVLKAAGTKWNFLPFKPGLVGGHCIGVDPYYLTYKAETMGYHPEVILAGRRINDQMGKFVVEKTVKLMCRAGRSIIGGRVAILGLTFKEDCADLRNTRVIDIVEEIQAYGITPLIHDPLADPAAARSIYGISMCGWPDLHDLDAVIIAVAHREYREMAGQDFLNHLVPGGCLIDVKGMLDPDAIRQNGFYFWRL
ncbi:MAG: nucleotide sugar dehydrogenase [Desulfosalsimonas sp.]|uniref:nucleotide sugar dehydrogenase n=1 Tax=Desulfosalsimonas sp. TaxID=3073848 RepID=UPI003970DF07